ncbi:MAG: hypothetical protein IPQ07_16365 [Myxococcales bacterium]|nr:hypothetical protein [Myxococcales bacterium]
MFASSTGGLEQTERAMAPSGGAPRTEVRYADHGIDATTEAIMRFLGIEGLQMAVSTACSSSFKALASASRLIDHGLADAVVVGSADSLCRTTVFGFHSLGLTAPTATQPFSRERNGITLGEGSAYVLIERATEATRRGALAWVAGRARPPTRSITRARTPRGSVGSCACARRSSAPASRRTRSIA